MQETQDRNSAIQTCSLNQLLDPDPTRVSHPAVTTTTYPAVGITHTGVSRQAVSILVLHTYPAVGITQTGVSRPAVSILVLHTYPAVDITHAGVSLPAVSTLIRYTGSAGHIDPVGVTQTLESDTDTREVQTALIVRLPHLPPLAARRPVGAAAAAAAGQAIAIVVVTAEGREQNDGSTIAALIGTTPWMIG